MRCPSLEELPCGPSGKTGWPWDQETPATAITRDSCAQLPRITIVTPSFNQADFLEETIRSVLLQNYPDLEYMIVDGGSNDGSVEIIRKYERWLSYWVSEKDHGQSDAINKGWRRATGRFVAWLNSDDYYLPGTLSQAAEVLSRETAAVVYGNCQYVNKAGIPVALRRPGPFDLEKVLNQMASNVFQPSTMIRRNVLDEVGLLRAELRYSMDLDLWLRIGMKFPLLYVDRTWSCCRLHEGAKTVSEQTGVWRQKLLVLQAAESSPLLPVRLRAMFPRIYHTYYFKRGTVELREGQYRLAAKCLWRAIKGQPGILLRRRSWRMLKSSLKKPADRPLQDMRAGSALYP